METSGEVAITRSTVKADLARRRRGCRLSLCYLLPQVRRAPAYSSRALRNLRKVSCAMAAGAWSGIAKTELTLISHKT